MDSYNGVLGRGRKPLLLVLSTRRDNTNSSKLRRPVEPVAESYRPPTKTETNALSILAAQLNIPIGDKQLQLRWTGSEFALVVAPGAAFTGLPPTVDNVPVLTPTEAEFAKLTSLETWAKTVYRGGPLAAAVGARYLLGRRWVTAIGLVIGGYLTATRLGD